MPPVSPRMDRLAFAASVFALNFSELVGIRGVTHARARRGKCGEVTGGLVVNSLFCWMQPAPIFSNRIYDCGCVMREVEGVVSPDQPWSGSKWDPTWPLSSWRPRKSCGKKWEYFMGAVVLCWNLTFHLFLSFFFLFFFVSWRLLQFMTLHRGYLLPRSL